MTGDYSPSSYADQYHAYDPRDCSVILKYVPVQITGVAGRTSYAKTVVRVNLKEHAESQENDANSNQY